jgi:membrane-bound serine protease (ClpP class)
VILIACVVASFFVPWPWNLVLILCGVGFEVLEIAWGRRLARRWRPKTGAEAMIGRRAQVVEPCRPDGRVRVDGELWNALCTEGADTGDTVRIVRVRELTLDVEPAR